MAYKVVITLRSQLGVPMTLETLDKTKFGKREAVASLYRLLANPVRLRILELLENRSMRFSELMRELAVNPKVLSNYLKLLMEFRLVAKSYPHNVYVLTPLGRRILREQIEAIYDYLHLFVKPVVREE